MVRRSVPSSESAAGFLSVLDQHYQLVKKVILSVDMIGVSSFERLLEVSSLTFQAGEGWG